MKKLFGFMLVATIALSFYSCSNSDKEVFDYPMKTLYGKWEGTGIYYNDEWIDLSNWMHKNLCFSISFNEDGTYYGEGFFGTGYGTYKTEGKNIITYVDGEKYLTYYVKSLSNDKAEITMYDNSGDSMNLRVKKVK